MVERYNCGTCGGDKLRIEARKHGIAVICMAPTCGREAEDSSVAWAFKRLAEPLPAPAGTTIQAGTVISSPTQIIDASHPSA